MPSPDSCNALNARVAQRWPVHYKVQFAYPGYAGEGVTLDVSAGGLCIITDREISPGIQVYARLVLPDNAQLEVPTATVKWCDNGQVGLEIAQMERQHAFRLLQLLSRVGGSAITYSKKYDPGSITIRSSRELGRYIVAAMEGIPIQNMLASISHHLRARINHYADAPMRHRTARRVLER